MKVHKDNEHCLTLSPFSWQDKRYLTVCVGQYVALAPGGGTGRVRAEQDFWKEAPDAFAALGRAPVMDAGLPKPGAEVLVAGFCRAPGRTPARALEVAFRVGPVRRRLVVFGDREHLPGGGYTEPVPFAAMPLVWERAFGGPGFPANPPGRGLDGDNAPSATAPNLEDPDHFILSRDDRPDPVCPLPVDMANPLRRALSGTYDQAWLNARWPAYPDDLDPEFFYSAQPAQRLAGRGPADNPLFFRGDEEIEIIGMSHEHPHIRSRLPEARIRAFILTAERFIPFAPARKADARGEEDGEKALLPYAKDLDRPGVFREVRLHLDTVWLLPDLMGAFTLRRGLLPVEDDEMDDILRVLVVTEKTHDAPQTPEFYREELRRRARSGVEIDLAPFAAARDKTAKLVKRARDLPKLLLKTKRDMLGQSPVMPNSLGDVVHSARQTLATGRATLDRLEKQTLAQRDQFSHLMNFDRLMGMFPRMRADLAAQEKNLELALRQAAEAMEKMSAAFRQDLDGALEALNQAGAGGLPAAEAAAGRAKILHALAALDSLTPEGRPFPPQPVNPWHDRGIALLAAAGRALRRDDALMSGLAALGFERETLNNILPGYNAVAVEDVPQAWGLEPGPAFVIPAGLYVPRFDGRTLVALRVYPAVPTDGPEQTAVLRSLGAGSADIFLAPGSDAAPLSLPAARPGGAVCVAPEDISAFFAEQEAGDFCHVAVAADPEELDKVRDLPPLLPDVPAEEGGLPLVVILPPGEAGQKLFAPWRAARPAAIPLHLPEKCPHVLALASRGHRLRRLLLDALPPEPAKVHDFDFPLPPKDGPPESFTLNLPLPGKEEIQGGVAKLLQEVTEHYLGLLAPGGVGMPLENLRGAGMPRELLDKMEAGIAAALKIAPAGFPPAPPETPHVAETLRLVGEKLAGMKASMLSSAPPEAREKLLDTFSEAEKKLAGAGERLSPLDGLSEKIRASVAAGGMDPDALKKPTREEVQAMLAAGGNLKGRNLQGLDLSGLD
ncbi:MAG: DUF2169 domain-containing protein, partial [Desulfovibrio sp.]|nr:DUF2169 domain-containing protein [Desulfovibrio sp.]